MFSTTLSRVLKIDMDSEINFYQDQKEPKNWFLKKEKGGMKIRHGNGKKAAFLVAASSIARRLLDSCNLKKSTTFLVSTEPIQGNYYAIITSSAKNSNYEFRRNDI
jgi:hypothetical protein